MDLSHGPGDRTRKTEMRFLKAVKRCIRKDRIRNERKRDALQIYSIKDKLDETRKMERTICKNGGGYPTSRYKNV
jgi:hypothetical protein